MREAIFNNVFKPFDFYPFGMIMPGRSFTATSSYRFGFNKGSLKDDEIKGDGNSYSTVFRELDVRVPIWWSIDPETKVWESPYVSMGDNPILKNDILGNKGESTHTDEDGYVIAVKNDGDNGVYKHKGDTKKALADFNKDYNSKTNTGAGGTKMGETLTPLSFANFETYERTGDVIEAKGAKIDFSSDWATKNVCKILDANPTALEYGLKAQGGNVWDIKTKTPNKNAYYGSKLFGKYASARDAGNFAAGAIAQKSILPNAFFDYGYGTYNMSGNHAGKAVLMVATDLSMFTMNPFVGALIMGVKAVYGENPLTQAGIDAGKADSKSMQTK